MSDQPPEVNVGHDHPAPERAGPGNPPSAAGAGGWDAPPPWGPPPAWQQGWPPSTPPPARTVVTLSRRVGVIGGILLVVAVVLGAGVGAAVASRGQPHTTGTAEVRVDSNPLAVASGGGGAEQVAAQLGPAVGTIINKLGGTGPTGGGGDALGSGFVIAHDGDLSYLLTNNHVVTGNKQLFVVMPSGTALDASVVGTDATDDLAVVSVRNGSLPLATFGDSATLRVGQAVVAIGSPLGNQGSVTVGVVSALHRTITAGGQAGTASETLQDVLQTDASINHGNSGGPLADLGGRVVGVNVAIAGDSSNIGFSIPSVLAKRVAEQLIARKPVQHPFLGIKYLDSIDAVEKGAGFRGPGVLVDDVVSGTPADRAGFHKGDVLEQVGGVTINNGQTLGGLIERYRVGDKVSFMVRRGSQEVSLTAALTERPNE